MTIADIVASLHDDQIAAWDRDVAQELLLEVNPATTTASFINGYMVAAWLYVPHQEWPNASQIIRWHDRRHDRRLFYGIYQRDHFTVRTVAHGHLYR